MPIFDTRVPKFKPPKEQAFSWDNFRGGLNTLLKENELDDNELAQMDNLLLDGKGVPTKRWGTSLYYLAGSSSVRGLAGYYPVSGSNQALSLTDSGFLTKKSGASYSTLTGASWASGYSAEMTQLNDNMYVVSESRELVRYNGTSLAGFPTISVPTSTFATQISGASGTNTYSYRVSATTEVGETLASSSVITQNQPQDLADGSIKVTWTAPSAASGVIKSYGIYGRAEGAESWVGSVDGNSTAFIDDGTATPQDFTFPPTADSTGGVKAKYIVRFQDRLIYGGVDGEPSKVIISGRVPNHEKTDVSFGGNFIRIEPDAGDDITGIATFKDKIVVFKERSVWQIALESIQIGNFYVTQPKATLITGSIGCIAPRSIKEVENDIFFLSRNGIYTLGNESGFIGDILRTNEISAKVRPFFESLTTSQKQNACAIYYKFKYVISFPGLNKSTVFDRERLAWMGPWNTDANIYEIYYDASNNEKLLYGEDSTGNVIEYSSSYGDDQGTAINTILRTKKEDFGDWVRFKNVKDAYLQFRNVLGSVAVDIRLQERSGNIITAKSFSIETKSGNAGWGADQWGDTLWGDSEEAGGASDINELYRWTNLNKAARNIQFIIKTDNRNDNYELIGIKSRANTMGLGFLPSGEKV